MQMKPRARMPYSAPSTVQARFVCCECLLSYYCRNWGLALSPVAAQPAKGMGNGAGN